VSAPTASRSHRVLRQAPARPLLVSEIFGPTFQGEGPSLGRRCSFLRLGGCNLACSWCDTPYTWDWTGRNGRRYDPRTELTQMNYEQAWEKLCSHGTDMLVVSGGEPLLQQAALVPLLELAANAGWRIEIETAGTIAPRAEVARSIDQFNISPKLGNSGNRKEDRLVMEALEALVATGKAIFKFVACEIADLDEIEWLVTDFQLSPVYVMPEGVTAEAVTARMGAIAAGVLTRGWNLTTRLHVLVYGNRRGV
jgi:7-carboxy-7-deazaguanine synthase